MKRFVSGLLVASSFAPTALAASVPMVTAKQLPVGAHWTWTYYTQGDFDRPYSAERYEVIASQGTLTTIEMRSRYTADGPFKAHTRFRVDLAKCWRSFVGPQVRRTFTIDLFPFTNGSWSRQAIATPATAFEEKFNCNPFVHAGGTTTAYETRFADGVFAGSAERLFQQWPRSPQSQLRAFYFLDHAELRGVAYAKEFDPGTPHYYRMQLTDWRTAPAL